MDGGDSAGAGVSAVGIDGNGYVVVKVDGLLCVVGVLLVIAVCGVM